MFVFISDDIAIHKTVVCLTEEKSNEVFLSCSNKTAIQVISALQGYQHVDETNVSETTTEKCIYINDPECAEEIVEYNEMLRSCMGQEKCNVLVNTTFIDACGKRGDYVQVEYECVQGRRHLSIFLLNTHLKLPEAFFHNNRYILIMEFRNLPRLFIN